LWTQADINDRAVYPTSSAVGWEGAAGLDLDLGGDWALAGDYRFYSFGVEFPAAGAGRPALDSDDLYHGVVLELSYRP
jgi:opacity protein-like surface antigen